MNNENLKRRGIGSLWVVLTLPIVIGLLGLVIDSGYAYLTSSQLQNAADAAALAAAAQLRSTGDTSAPIAKAQEIALLNTAAAKTVVLASSDVVCGRYYLPGDSTDKLGFYPAETPLNAVQVTARRTTDSAHGPLALLFGPIFGINSIEVSSVAIAMTDSKAPGLIVLDPTGQDALLMNGSIVINVESGTVTVNSSSKYAVKFMDNSQIIATELDIVGDYYGGTGKPLPIIHTGVTPAADPLKEQLKGQPDLTNVPPGTRNAVTRTFTPGYFSGGISIGDGKTWTFQPGIYVVDHPPGDIKAVSIGAGCIANGSDVIIVVKTGSLNIGDSTVNFTPPTSGTYAGICFFQPKDNTTPASIGGHSHISGMIYIPHAQINIGGSYTDYYATQILCYRLKVDSAVHISVPLGPRAGGTGHCFLVK
jgi:hypothetical protein